MSRTEIARKTLDTTAKDVARQRATRIAEHITEPAEQFKSQAAEQIEDLASQIRKLGGQLERDDEAHQVARRLERTADYLRYRPARDVADDAWQTITGSPAVWIGGGLVAGLALYYGIHRRRRRDS